MGHPGSSLKFPLSVLPAVLLPLALGGLAGCGSMCPSGFTEQDDGTCLRNHYGDPGSADDTATDDTGEEVSPDAPTVTFVLATFGTDDDGTEYMKLELSATDPQPDIVDGEVNVQVDTGDAGKYGRTIHAGSPGETPQYNDSLLNGTELTLWLPDVTPEQHDLAFAVIDAAGNQSATVTTVVTPPAN